MQGDPDDPLGLFLWCRLSILPYQVLRHHASAVYDDTEVNGAKGKKVCWNPRNPH